MFRKSEGIFWIKTCLHHLQKQNHTDLEETASLHIGRVFAIFDFQKIKKYDWILYYCRTHIRGEFIRKQ